MQNGLYLDHIMGAVDEAIAQIDLNAMPDRDALLGALREARQRRNLTFILGAGVSIPSGIPSWLSLIEKAAGLLLNDRPDLAAVLVSEALSATRKIRFCESVAGLKTGFRAVLSRVIYEQYDEKRPNGILDALCQITLGLDGGSRIPKVISYNFDNLLERQLQVMQTATGLAIELLSAYSEETYARANDHAINVIHPHGFLPNDLPFSAIANIPLVFSEDDCHDHFLNHAFWANVCQMQTFKQSACLFVGLSFECPNLRRLLDFSSKGLNRRPLRVAILRSPKGPQALEKRFLLTRDLSSFAVQPLWVDDFAEIPNVLYSLKA